MKKTVKKTVMKKTAMKKTAMEKTAMTSHLLGWHRLRPAGWVNRWRSNRVIQICASLSVVIANGKLAQWMLIMRLVVM